MIALRKKEIQLKIIINKIQKISNIENELQDLFTSKFYLTLSKIMIIEDIMKIEDIDKFIREYEDYLIELEEIREVIFRSNSHFFIFF